jgi:ribosomal protein S1
MIEQEVTLQMSDDPFDTKTVKVRLPKGIKLMSREPYVLELLKKYGHIEDYEDVAEAPNSFGNEIITGEIIAMFKDHALIDIGGGKYTASCNLDKESSDIVEQLKVGMSLGVFVKSKGNGEYIASISDAMKIENENEIKNSIGDKTVAFRGKIKELIHGGYWVNISGVTCFMPGSLAGLNKITDFESLVGKEMIFMPINYSNEKNTVIVSHREYLKTLIPSAIENLKSNMKEMVTGIVTGTTKFGIFAEFNTCLTGLMPKESLDEGTLSKFESRSIKPGDTISFWVNNIISDEKIILSQEGPRFDPWDEAAEKYKPMSITTGIVSKVTKYGAFIQLEKGISGLIHNTQTKGLELNKGDEINVKIIQVNAADRKISMTLP